LGIPEAETHWSHYFVIHQDKYQMHCIYPGCYFCFCFVGFDFINCFTINTCSDFNFMGRKIAIDSYFPDSFINLININSSVPGMVLGCINNYAAINFNEISFIDCQNLGIIVIIRTVVVVVDRIVGSG
jgi:hypothetical protein